MTEIKPFMTIPKFARATGLPEGRIRMAAKGEYKNSICAGGAPAPNKTTYIDTEIFLKLLREGRI